ncbi:hypothetical protein Pla108_20220 [Botrimarina colliarenosi]|uniref:Competence protein A n=1 Tax=Botrimarina colliarenosi TaxID=2528001 RepID=A0A5C6AEX2_9BACT|nr:PilN domain-containing protein [Botrimarina colliarenosi]TWT97868.1 hypothetical protein Pla108_20220 [Botrimarina colliarenosi]
MKKSNEDRRQASDRRNVSSRRRHAESRRISIELCHSVLRVALVIDSENSNLPVLRTLSIPWRKKAKDLLCPEGRVELAAALRSLVNQERLAGCQVAFAISSTLCVNRATSGATAKVEQELGELRERSQMYLSLGPGAKTAAIARKNIDARHEHALVTVTNERTLALLVEAAESAGLTVAVVESALVALSRLQGRLEPEEPSSVLMVQLDEDRFEVGVSQRGQLLVEYRPSSDSTTDRLGKVVDDHHDRLKRFCQRQYGVGAGDIERMWLVGEPGEVAATDAITRRKIATSVLPLDALTDLWTVQDAEPMSAEMGAALGLALRGRDDASSVSPNLMDAIHAGAKQPIRPFLMRAATPLVAALLLAAGLWLFNLEQRSELMALRSEVEAAKPVYLQGQRLSKQLADATLEIEHLSRLEKKIPERQMTPLIQGVGFCLPDDVWLKALRFSDLGSVTLEGASYTEGSLYDFVHNLEDAPTFQEVALRGTGVEQTPQGPATSFGVDLGVATATTASGEVKP